VEGGTSRRGINLVTPHYCYCLGEKRGKKAKGGGGRLLTFGYSRSEEKVKGRTEKREGDVFFAIPAWREGGEEEGGGWEKEIAGTKLGFSSERKVKKKKD